MSSRGVRGASAISAGGGPESRGERGRRDRGRQILGGDRVVGTERTVRQTKAFQQHGGQSSDRQRRVQLLRAGERLLFGCCDVHYDPERDFDVLGPAVRRGHTLPDGVAKREGLGRRRR